MIMEKRILLPLALLFVGFFCGQSLFAQTINVPSSLKFADLQLNLNEEARKQIEHKANQLIVDTAYYNSLKERTYTYMPVVMRTLKAQGVPEDLAYLALKETSLLQSGMDERKLPAGVWKITPNQNEDWKLNLLVSSKIDERKHIGVATAAIARKLKNDNYSLRNWLNTVLAYGFGFMEVSQTADPQQKGATTVEIHGQTNPYLIDLLAYVLVFKDINFKPTTKSVSLLEYSDSKGKNMAMMAKMVGLSENQLKAYNPWLTNKDVPDERNYTVYFPATETQKAEMSSILSKQNTMLPLEQYQQTDFPLVIKKQTININNRIYTLINANGLSAIMVDGKDTPANLIKITKDVKLSKFLKYNEIQETDTILPKIPYYLEQKKDIADVPFHELASGENYWLVSQKYGMRYKELLSLNRMEKNEPTQVGRILWLQSKRDKSTQVEIRKPQPTESEPVNNTNTSSVQVLAANGTPEDPNFTYYTATDNENIYDVSWRLGVRIDSLRKWNNLGSEIAIDRGKRLIVGKKIVPPTNTQTVENKVVVPNDLPNTNTNTNNTNTNTTATNNVPVTKTDTNSNSAVASKQLVHTIQSKEGLAAVARRYGVKLQSLIADNKIVDANKVKAGDKIVVNNPVIGFSKADLKTTAPQTALTKADTTKKALMEEKKPANSTNPTNPTNATSPTFEATKTIAKQDSAKPFVEQPFLKDSIYIVRNEGENFESIVKKLNLPKKDTYDFWLYVKTWNQPPDREIQTNETLPKGMLVKLAEKAVMPSQEAINAALNQANAGNTTSTNTGGTGVVENIVAANTVQSVRYEDYKDSTYTVQSGEYLYLIAKKTGVPDYRYLLRWNGYKTENPKLDIGDRLIVKGDLSVPIDTKPMLNGKVHHTQLGENVYSLAKLYNVSADSLAAWNGLQKDAMLPLGKDLVITRQGNYLVASGKTDDKTGEKANEKNAQPFANIYLVRNDGESLKSIAEKLKLPDVAGSPFYLYMKSWNNADENAMLPKGTAIKIAENAVMPSPAQIQEAMKNRVEVGTSSKADAGANGAINQDALLPTQGKGQKQDQLNSPAYTTAQPFKEVHIVRMPNETLKSIAEKYKFQPIGGHDYAAYMQAWNNIEDTNMALPIGKAVKLSDAAVLPSDAELAKVQQTIPPTAGNGTHTVVQGETLYTIAKRYNVDKKYLEVWNKVDDDTPLKAGQTLVIQGDMKTEVPQYSKFYTDTHHIAQDGETLTEIAKFHKISLPNLLEWNNLAANASLKEGQRLWIKPRPAFHKVWQGETIDMIANMYEISPQDIYTWNNFAANYVLKKGETIIVSQGAVLPPKQETPPALPKEETVSQTQNIDNQQLANGYYAQMGETLADVCRRFGVSTIDFKLWNQLPYQADKLEEGKKYHLTAPKTVVVPPTASRVGEGQAAGNRYVVGKNETLYTIARKFNITIYQLRAWNNLKTDSVREGESLIVNKK
jgi:membrane-bound lytic murein transglycosylase D